MTTKMQKLNAKATTKANAKATTKAKTKANAGFFPIRLRSGSE
jgi:hypothetical protein